MPYSSYNPQEFVSYFTHGTLPDDYDYFGRDDQLEAKISAQFIKNRDLGEKWLQDEPDWVMTKDFILELMASEWLEKPETKKFFFWNNTWPPTARWGYTPS